MSLSQSKIAAVAAVSEMNRARAFYEGVLGLSAIDGSPEAEEVVYACGEGTELVVYLSMAGAGKATIAAWEVEDLEAEMDGLTASGVKFEHYDEPGPKTDERGVAELHGERIAWFKDPDGNTYAISKG
ncbi:MAG: VOC family protein [Solirubrobacterales bacterium]|nr:VOC family protein [Solirubrobacterales bacterium]